MNFFIILTILFAIQSLCRCHSNDVLCKAFHQKAKFFEKYCNNYDGFMPSKCVEVFDPRVESCQVHFLKIGGCSGDIVWQTLSTFRIVRSLDVSNSRYTVLTWLDPTNFELDHLERFNASHNDLEHLHGLLVNAKALIEINLSFNKLKTIDATSFGQHANLEKILLNDNQLEFMTLDAFKSVPNLKFIDLRNNKFRQMPDLPYSYFIEVIHMEGNDIFYMKCPQTNSARVHLRWLSVLSFYGGGTCDGLQMQIVTDAEREGLSTAEANYRMFCNAKSFRQLSSFTAGRNAFTNVTILLPYFTARMANINLSGNYVGAVNASTFDVFERLMSLSLSDTQLTIFDFWVLKSQRNRLESLDLSHNGLEYIDNVAHLKRFQALNSINVAGNRLNNTMELIQNLRSPSIKYLDVSDGNKVGKLHAETFEHIHSLETLKLHNTNLSIVNFEAFRMLKNLKHLDISRNNLSHVNASDFAVFAQLNDLIKLNIAYCQLRNISFAIRELNSTIQELDVSGNDIGSFQPNTFQSLHNLHYLNLSNTNIFRVNFVVLKNLTNLRILDISYNKLQYANVEQLPRSLKNLHLEGNDLTEIDKITSTQFPVLESLAMSKNQFSCLTLRTFMSKKWDLYFLGDPLDQKHGKFCRCSVHGILDYLDVVYDKVRFW